jgi:predicted RNA methylase
MQMGRNFRGTIVDFGCGLGDAMPVYRRAYPGAKLIGVDIAPSAVELCRARYGDIAHFMEGDCDVVPSTDVIVSSNVVEHLDSDTEAVTKLLARCGDLYVTVPYRETPGSTPEHVHSYDEHSFRAVGKHTVAIFASKGWGPYGLDLFLNVHLKNLLRPWLHRPLKKRPLQIMYHFTQPRRS